MATARYDNSGVKSWSCTTSKRNVRPGARVEFSVTVIGMSAGGAPRCPAIAVARSCEIVPTVAPRLASLLDVTMLGRTAMTSARVIGNSVGPRL